MQKEGNEEEVTRDGTARWDGRTRRERRVMQILSGNNPKESQMCVALIG